METNNNEQNVHTETQQVLLSLCYYKHLPGCKWLTSSSLFFSLLMKTFVETLTYICVPFPVAEPYVLCIFAS